MKREWKETARRNIDRALIFQSNTHVATQNTHTHILKHTQTQCPLPQILLSTRPSRLIQRRKKSTSFSSPGGYVCSVNIPIGCVLIHSLFLGEMQAHQHPQAHTHVFSFFSSNLISQTRQAGGFRRTHPSLPVGSCLVVGTSEGISATAFKLRNKIAIEQRRIQARRTKSCGM